MRRLALSFAPATLALVVLMACEDSETGGGPTLDLDSGNPNFDATTGFDATLPDAAPDAPVTPQVGVTATNYKGPLAGVRVVFHAADGAVIETKLTGADGKATHIGSDAAMVSALYGPQEDGHIVTWTGVEVGDNLLLKDTRVVEESHIGEYDVTISPFPSGSPDRVDLEHPCGDAQAYGTGETLYLFSYCARAKNSVLAKAVQYNAGTLGYAFKKGIDGITDAGTSVVPIDGWKTPGKFTLNVTNVPVETYIDARISEVADGHAFGFGYGQTEDNYATTEFEIAQDFADAHQVSIHRGNGNGGRGIVAKRIPGANTTTALDYNAFLPSIDDLSLDTSSPHRPKLSWSSQGGLGTTDGGIVSFVFEDGGESQSRWVTWTFVVPPTATSVTAPAMPPEAVAYLPLNPDSGSESDFRIPHALFIESDVIPGYAFVRQQQGAVLDTLGSSLATYEFPALPIDGTYRATTRGPLPAFTGKPAKPAPTH